MTRFGTLLIVAIWSTMGAMARLYRGDDWRISRLHDMRGNLVGWRDLVSLPSILWGAAAREAWGYRPELPWIPSGARAAIAALLTPTSTVLEFGAGMSTLWLARRCAQVHAVEHDQEWADRISALARTRGIANLKVEFFSADDPRYPNPPGCAPTSVDLVIVDGVARPMCARSAVALVKQPGSIYLDNTDFGSQWQWYLDTEAILLRAAGERDGKVQYFTGFAPATVVASQGMLVTFGASQI